MAVAELAHYQLTEPWEFTATFKVGGALTDPTTVDATVRPPDGVLVEPAAWPPNNATITKASDGVFKIAGTASQAGRWYVEVVGTGAAAAIERFEFEVDPRWPSDLLEPYALITIEEAERYLRRQNVQTTGEAFDDQAIADAINEASSAVFRYLDRTLLPLETAATKRFPYDGTGYLDLAPYELRAATTITTLANLPAASQYVLINGSATVTGEWLAHPAGLSPFGTYTWLELPTLYAFSEVTVLGNWGAPTIPDDVKRAVKIAVYNWYTNPAQFARVAIGGLEAEPAVLGEAEQSLPVAARGILTPYRR